MEGDISNDATSMPLPSFTLNIANKSEGFIVMAASLVMSMALESMNAVEPAGPKPFLTAPFVVAKEPEGGGEFIFAVADERSRKASDGEKPSGLLCCELESLEPPDRSVFLRIGRIHGGRGFADCELSGRGDSKGI